jgi:hypothetical protein
MKNSAKFLIICRTCQSFNTEVRPVDPDYWDDGAEIVCHDCGSRQYADGDEIEEDHRK